MVVRVLNGADLNKIEAEQFTVKIYLNIGATKIIAEIDTKYAVLEA